MPGIYLNAHIRFLKIITLGNIKFVLKMGGLCLCLLVFPSIAKLPLSFLVIISDNSILWKYPLLKWYEESHWLQHDKLIEVK